MLLTQGMIYPRRCSGQTVGACLLDLTGSRYRPRVRSCVSSYVGLYRSILFIFLTTLYKLYLFYCREWRGKMNEWWVCEDLGGKLLRNTLNYSPWTRSKRKRGIVVRRFPCNAPIFEEGTCPTEIYTFAGELFGWNGKSCVWRKLYRDLVEVPSRNLPGGTEEILSQESRFSACLTFVSKLRGSYLGRDTDGPDRGFSWFFSNFP
jgi:hypothetical protein